MLVYIQIKLHAYWYALEHKTATLYVLVQQYNEAIYNQWSANYS